jgi:hypothetical protein
MVNKRFWIKVLVIVFVFGMVTVACHGQTIDSRLNGTWISTINEGKGLVSFNNGTFEGGWDGVISSRGNYTTSAGKITIQYTFSQNVYNEIWSYSINNNILTIIYDDDPEPYTYTRKE